VKVFAHYSECGGAIERSYRRIDLFTQRRSLMDEWFLTSSADCWVPISGTHAMRDQTDRLTQYVYIVMP
jgi:hypothetical protein